MLLLDLDKKLSIYSPGRTGSDFISHTLQHLLITGQRDVQQQSWRGTIHDTLPLMISSNPVEPEYYHFFEALLSMNISNKKVYQLFRSNFGTNFDKHYVVVRNPLDRIISGYTMVYGVHYSKHNPRLNFTIENDCVSSDNAKEIFDIVHNDPLADYHIQPYIKDVDVLDNVYVDTKNLTPFIKTIYNIDANDRSFSGYIDLDLPQNSIEQNNLIYSKIKNVFKTYFDLYGNNDKVIQEIEKYNSIKSLTFG
jgi:hypothetical protein